ncbi:DUF6090 family protein [Winogradskyella vincentii]|uniref:Uncharacterized protein n=1 Tax=Winogradskyella vincentii TaxID=2877122 RepID=A0ABS7XW05_9FLAO|nr:DUF6090 family protein [Winogradskyella vincentii]MCA0151824.1 hypothetical protein [Winogradskyella vincentii]
MEKKSTKYLKYAIGEIILVVIGILIALQINNWNELRKQKLLKINYLERLSNDIKQDTLNINKVVYEINKNQDCISNFIKTIGTENNTVSLDSAVTSYFERGWIISEFSPISNTYTDLSQTGNMKIIDNSELVDQIIEYYGYIDIIEKSNSINKDWITSIDIEVAQETPAFQLDPNTRQLFAHKNLDNAIKGILDNKDLLERNAAGHYWINESLSNNLLAIKGVTKELLSNIEKELDAIQ